MLIGITGNSGPPACECEITGHNGHTQAQTSYTHSVITKSQHEARCQNTAIVFGVKIKAVTFMTSVQDSSVKTQSAFQPPNHASLHAPPSLPIVSDSPMVNV